jgi:hypothetical protein
VEDLASDHTQQDDQQQTGSNAKGGEESDSHNASFTLDVQFARKCESDQGDPCKKQNINMLYRAQQEFRSEVSIPSRFSQPLRIPLSQRSDTEPGGGIARKHLADTDVPVEHLSCVASNRSGEHWLKNFGIDSARRTSAGIGEPLKGVRPVSDRL